MFDLVDVLAAHHRLEKIIVRTLITTIMLLLFTSQAQAVTNTYDPDGKLVSVSPLTLSDGMTYGVTIEYGNIIDGGSPGSGLTDELNDEAAEIIANGDATGPIYHDFPWTVFFLSDLQSGHLEDGFEIDGLVWWDSDGDLHTQQPYDIYYWTENSDFSLQGADPGTWNNGTITFTKITAAVPEPLTATLIPLAVAPLLLRRRREA